MKIGDNMKRINFNIKDRKVLTLGLCLVVVCVFTLTVAYSALSAVLTISGNARVSAAAWDIYLNNYRTWSRKCDQVLLFCLKTSKF